MHACMFAMLLLIGLTPFYTPFSIAYIQAPPILPTTNGQLQVKYSKATYHRTCIFCEYTEWAPKDCEKAEPVLRYMYSCTLAEPYLAISVVHETTLHLVTEHALKLLFIIGSFTENEARYIHIGNLTCCK